MLEQMLSQLEFSPNQQRVIRCLMATSSLSASMIAKRAGLKRPTTYLALEELIEQGFVTRKRKGGVASFSLTSEDLFLSLLENRASQRFESVKYTCGELRSYFKNQNQRVDISGFEIETLQSYDAVYEQLLDVLTRGDYDAIFNPQIVCHTEVAKNAMRLFMKTTAETKARIREIIVSGAEAEWYKKQVNNPNHQIKEISKDKKIMSDMIFADTFVIVSHYEPPDELAIKIQHQGFLMSQKTVFEMLWDSL